MAKAKSKAKKTKTAAEAVNDEVQEKAPVQSRKQIRDAVKKKARTKKRIITVIVTAIVSILVVALIAVGIFFSMYDPLGDNIEATVDAIFTMPYNQTGSQDLTSDNPLFPLDQAAYFYFYSNYSDYMTEDCCMSLKDSVENWNGWNTQKEGYRVVAEDFAYSKSTSEMGYFDVILTFYDSEDTLVDAMIMSGAFSFDPETNLITNIRFDNNSLIELGEMYSVHVLGNEPKTEEETAE